MKNCNALAFAAALVDVITSSTTTVVHRTVTVTKREDRPDSYRHSINEERALSDRMTQIYFALDSCMIEDIERLLDRAYVTEREFRRCGGFILCHDYKDCFRLANRRLERARRRQTAF